MKKTVFILILSITVSTLFAQISLIDLEGYFKGKYATDYLQNLSWRPQSNQYSYVENDSLILCDANTQKHTTFLTVKKLKAILQEDNFNKIPYCQWITNNSLYFPSLNKMISFDQTGNFLESQTFPAQNIIDKSIKDRLFVCKENGTVYVQSYLNDYQKMLLCPDTGKNIVFGEAVHRNEWGINEGQYFSPKGHFIAFYRMDESMVEDYPLVNTSMDIAMVEPMKYPMAGRKNHEVKVGIFDVKASVAKHQTVYHYIETDWNDGEFLTCVTFSPDEQFLYITHLNRAQNHAKLVQYDVNTGKKIKVLIEEKDPRYVEPNKRIIFLKDQRFIWQSDRDGWNHCYLYDSNGKLIKQLTKGNWEVTSVLGMDSKEECLYFITPYKQPVDRYVYRINMKNGDLQNLTLEMGTHTPFFNDEMSWFIDYYTNLETPLKIFLKSSNGKKSKLLLESKNPYKAHQLGKNSIFTIKNKQNDDLYCRMILPPHFDSTKKYPCIIYVYGGPHSQMVTNTFMSGGSFLYYLSQRGYIIFTLDNRGTSNRGAEFEKTIHRRLGVLEIEDQMCGVDYLKSRPYVDSNRIGLDGWSYGGFMILSLITTYPDVFKAASCGGPVVDWRWYEIMYGERYMDTPEENPQGYVDADILPKVKNIKTNLLVMHGAQDHTVVWQHTLRLLDQAIKDGIQLEYFVYPSHDHNVRGIQRVYLWKKLEHFFETEL
ncbi:MAG: DPP IV N-terminal domain-containing protein [Bacteroidales bacterium]